jgi:hypothetical protein
LKRYLAVAAIALLIVISVAGWMLHEAWKKSASVRGLFPGIGQGLEALGQGIESVATELANGATFAQQFVGDLAEDRLGSAYQATSQSLKQQMNEETFAKFVNGHPAVKDSTVQIDFVMNKKSGNSKVSVSGNVTRIRIPPGQGTVKLDTSKGARNVKLVLVSENGKLKVDELELGKDKAP